MNDVLADRYGAPKRARRMLLLVLIAVFAIAGLGWTAWAAWFHGNEPIQSDVTAYQVVDEHHIKARVRVHLRDADVTGTCLLRATAADHSIVGERDVSAQALAGKPHWVTVRTEREATTVEFIRCSAK